MAGYGPPPPPDGSPAPGGLAPTPPLMPTSETIAVVASNALEDHEHVAVDDVVPLQHARVRFPGGLRRSSASRDECGA